ncbi:AI-2E family transporter [Parerythrobacter jejuensis]|uniref:AI-2E family transporter n=1 Tax=Parerythrobacter jejuensis TaxID=795812 RepID=A0A845APL1_9SPHN|nr:AI-2E family transporter [Parerythrobacter jejuensis]MXP30426.1 AI-2E family transporter [Parerythrobacter jejuensis]MXP33186.1 AI-2E family transporter [Parerythrobacter jejuensis]
MSNEPTPADPAPQEPAQTSARTSTQPSARPSKRTAFAEQELRLISTLVLLIGLGLFLALPFVLSIGSVVFLPLTTAIVLTILLSPLADQLARIGLPNVVSSMLALLIFCAIVLVAFAVILQPAISLFDEFPDMVDQVGARFTELQQDFAWLARANAEFMEVMGRSGANEVVLATPSVFEQLAVGAPSLVLEILLTFLMAFFLIESRIRLRRNLLFGRTNFGTSIKAARVMREVQDRVAAYILTVAWINLGVGVVVGCGAWLLGVDAPLMWGGLAALLNFIPYIGPLAMTGILTLFGIATADTLFLGLVPAAAYLALHTVEANVVTPSILGARFTMNPVMILIAFSYFTWVWGAFGALLSVPILLMLTAFFDHVGRPNLIGFIFGEPLFATPLMEIPTSDETQA